MSQMYHKYTFIVFSTLETTMNDTQSNRKMKKKKKSELDKRVVVVVVVVDGPVTGAFWDFPNALYDRIHVHCLKGMYLWAYIRAAHE